MKIRGCGEVGKDIIAVGLEKFKPSVYNLGRKVIRCKI